MTRRHWILAALLLSLAACDADGDDAGRSVGVTASDRIELTAETPEPIVEIAVPEGTAVTAGTVLVRQDPARAQAEVAAAEAELGRARARLAELVRGPRSEQLTAARANVDGARNQLTFRLAEYERIRKIFEQGLVAADLRDQARAALDTARANLDRDEAQLEELLAGTTVEELDQAEAAVSAAQARVDTARIGLERLTLRAPVDGIADSRLFEIGERPPSGAPVFILLGGNQAYARVYVGEQERAGVRPGTRARVTVDGIDVVLDGRVRWVASEAAFTPYFALTERDRGRLTYEAKVDILGHGERLPDGVPVEVEFLADKAGE